MKFVRSIGSTIVQIFGSDLTDEVTGRVLGRAILLSWRGSVHVIGYNGRIPLRPVFKPDPEVRFWRQSIGFVAADEPDYANESC